MTALELFSRQSIEIIPLHFDVTEHYLSLEVFIETTKNTKKIIDTFNKEFFEGKLQYEIVILPPKVGGFINRVGLCVLVGASWAFINSDAGSAYIKGLTGQPSAYWAEKAGHATLEFAEDEVANIKKTAVILTESTKGFLQKDTDSLRKVGVSKEKFRDAYEARNEFYTTCVDNKNIKGLGFDDSHQFPIKRSDFTKFIVELPPKEEETAEWSVEIKEVRVTSPNWSRNDDIRGWKAKYDRNKTVFFNIEDDNFWELVGSKKIKPKIVDTLKVQWAFQLDRRGPKHCKVLRVLEYNGIKISNHLLDSELKKVLKNYSHFEDDQTDLFSISNR